MTSLIILRLATKFLVTWLHSLPDFKLFTSYRQETKRLINPSHSLHVIVCTSTKCYINRNCIFFQQLTPNITSAPQNTWRQCRSRLKTSRVIHVVVAYCSKLKPTVLDYLQWHNIYAKFRAIWLRVSKLKIDTNKQHGNLIILHFFSAYEGHQAKQDTYSFRAECIRVHDFLVLLR